MADAFAPVRSVGAALTSLKLPRGVADTDMGPLA
jgi:hypothetical protein